MFHELNLSLDSERENRQWGASNRDQLAHYCKKSWRLLWAEYIHIQENGWLFLFLFSTEDWISEHNEMGSLLRQSLTPVDIFIGALKWLIKEAGFQKLLTV